MPRRTHNAYQPRETTFIPLDKIEPASVLKARRRDVATQLMCAMIAAYGPKEFDAQIGDGRTAGEMMARNVVGYADALEKELNA